MAVVELTGIDHRYGPRSPWVLRGLSAKVEPGTVVEVVGANGSGKSTLLRLLAGCTRPTGGSRAAADVAVGYAPDRVDPAPPLRASAFLSHHARMRRAPYADVIGLADRLDCRSLLERRMTQLSTGSLRKVLLVQAFLGRPALVVLDEPFGPLDRESAELLSGVIEQYAGSGGAVVFSHHRGGAAAHRRWRVVGGRISEVDGG